MVLNKRLPEDVAQDIAWIIQSSGVHKPHPFTVDYVHGKVHEVLCASTIAWYEFIFGIHR